MASARARLDGGGGRLLGDEPPAIHAEFLRIAAILRQRGCRSVGLVAAGDAAVAPVARRVGLALAELTGRRTGVVDARRTRPEDALRSRPDEARQGPACAAAAPGVTWIAENVALVAAVEGGDGRRVPPELRAFFATLEHVVFDLTGFDATGEHLDAMAMLDGVAIVARAGITTNDDLERWMRDVPAERNLGVILVGAPSASRGLR